MPKKKTTDRQKLYNVFHYGKKLNPELIAVFEDYCDKKGLNKSKEMLKSITMYMKIRMKIDEAEEKILQEEEKRLDDLTI